MRSFFMNLTYVRVHVPNSTEAAAVRVLIDLMYNIYDFYRKTHSNLKKKETVTNLHYISRIIDTLT